MQPPVPMEPKEQPRPLFAVHSAHIMEPTERDRLLLDRSGGAHVTVPPPLAPSTDENEEENPASVTVSHSEVNVALLTVMISTCVSAFGQHWFRFSLALCGVVLTTAVFILALYASFFDRHRVNANQASALLAFFVMIIQITLDSVAAQDAF